MVAAVRQHSLTWAPFQPSRLERFVMPAVVTALLVIVALVVRLAATPAHPSVRIADGDFSKYLDAYDTRPPTDVEPAWTPRPSPDIDESARAVRIGARIIDVEVASVAQGMWMTPAYQGDRTAQEQARRAAPVVAAYAGELSALLADAPDQDYAAALFSRVMTQAQLVATPAWSEVRVGRQEAISFHPDFIALGNWLEAARIAAARGNRGFFDMPASRAEAANLTAIAVPSERSRDALARVQRLMPDGRAGNLVVLERALTNALRALAN